jgi:UDP-N-acetylmuramate-alanine ligase
VRGRDDGDGRSSKELSDLITKPNAIYKSSFDKAYVEVMKDFDSQKTILVFMGAGDIDEQLRANL